MTAIVYSTYDTHILRESLSCSRLSHMERITLLLALIGMCCVYSHDYPKF